MDSDKESEVKRSINVQGPYNIQRERSVEASNVNNEEPGDSDAEKEIRDGLSRLNVNIPENFDDLNNNTICTPRYTNQLENVKSLSTIFDIINNNELQYTHII